VGREELSRLIHKRLDGSVSLARINDAVGVISRELQCAMVDDVPVTVRNFGTLSPCWHHAHRAVNVSTGQPFEARSCPRVKFHASVAFEELLKLRRDRFLKIDE